MSQEKIRIPIAGGLDEARRKLKEMRKKEPSSEFVKIIEGVTNHEPEKKSESDIADKPHDQNFDL